MWKKTLNALKSSLFHIFTNLPKKAFLIGKRKIPLFYISDTFILYTVFD